MVIGVEETVNVIYKYRYKIPRCLNIPIKNGLYAL